MTRFGYTLMTEQSGPTDLVKYAVAAENIGFDFEVSSDHYSPWLTSQGHAPYAWTLLGAVAQATTRVELATYVTCPSIRYHPAVVAQKAATLQLLADGRFILGLGAGENLNEHVVGEGWPMVDARQDMFEEAVQIIRALHTGELVTWEGEYFRVDSARIWDLPDEGVPLGLAVSGDKSIARFAPLGDHLIATEPDGDLVSAWQAARDEALDSAGGSGSGDADERTAAVANSGVAGGETAAVRKPVAETRSIGQIPICWGPDKQSAIEMAHDQFRWFAGGWAVNADLPTPAGFAGASQFVRPDDVAESIACGPDLDELAESVKPFLEAGFTDVAIVQVGDARQQEFLDTVAEPLLEKLRAL
ncbi:TIGR03557 family F420-dependent LLM class oxidoreductase [Subtercola sp. YIM 133946]|uniref:TIGR03557 family F420-dependent LLM class oxidoreductase n=1 Tax=Subtercola sp. YIM 133946 TaxID=3118909 RepID=UPI002F958761